MRALLPFAVALLAGGCTIQRDLPLERYACGYGGPCDAGFETPLDAGSRDATPGKDVIVGEDVPTPDVETDAGVTPDGGDPLAACPKIEPLPNNGLASGDNTAGLNSYEPYCSAPGGRDAVYGFSTQGVLRELIVSTDGSSFDTALHLYRDDCTPANLITCNDEDESAQTLLQSTSFLLLEDVPPGNYAVIVDAFGDSTGTYLLRVSGKIAPGERCDPAQTYLTCEIGTCRDEGAGGFRCPDVLDCLDGVDADEDGTIDEDACVDPPLVSCSPVAPPQSGELVDLSATVFDAGSIVYRQWRVIERPFGSFDLPFDPGQESTLFYPDLAGTFRIRYRAADDLFQLSACEVTFTSELVERLRAELIWNGELLHHEHHALVNLHLLHPNAQRWFDPVLDCASPNCLNVDRDWGQTGQQADDPFLIGLRLGPQWVTVFQPSTNGTYGVGVEYEFDNYRASTSAVVNIYCDGALEQTLGPVILSNGAQFPEDNDFWKVAEVDMLGSGCDVFPYLDGGLPEIITGAEAEAAR